VGRHVASTEDDGGGGAGEFRRLSSLVRPRDLRRRRRSHDLAAGSTPLSPALTPAGRAGGAVRRPRSSPLVRAARGVAMPRAEREGERKSKGPSSVTQPNHLATDPPTASQHVWFTTQRDEPPPAPPTPKSPLPPPPTPRTPPGSPDSVRSASPAPPPPPPWDPRTSARPPGGAAGPAAAGSSPTSP